MDCSPSGSSVHGIFQAWILEWVAISFSRGPSRPRDRTRVSCIVGRRFTVQATREAIVFLFIYVNREGNLLFFFLTFWPPSPDLSNLQPCISGNHQSGPCINEFGFLFLSSPQKIEIRKYFSLWLISVSILLLWSIHVVTNGKILFYVWIIFHCVYVCVYIYTDILQFHYSFIHWWTLRLFPCLGYGK